MSKAKRKVSVENPDALFGRVVSILEQARGQVVRAVNTQMVLAYWLIGREIIEELQGGDKRATYGKKVVEALSTRLTERYGQGFSGQTLWKFRLFYQVYSDRFLILSPSGIELGDAEKISPLGIKSAATPISCPAGTKSGVTPILRPIAATLFPAAHVVALPRPDAGGDCRGPRFLRARGGRWWLG